MPEAFVKCVKNGGRVRTKKLDDGKYIHICFIGGKSYSGEVKQSQEELDQYIMKIKDGDIKLNETIEFTEFSEELSFNIDESSVNEEKGTVEVCVLAPCISRNGRYYSPGIVEKAFSQMSGKAMKAYAGHDDRSPKNIVASFPKSGVRMDNGKLYAQAKFSKARDVAESILTRIKEGIITDVSIAASGTTKTMQMGEKTVQSVEEKTFRLASVDFVGEGGVDASKVVKVFEDVNELPNLSEVKNMEIKDVKQLREAYADLVEKIEKPLNDKISELTTKVSEAEAKLIEKELNEHKEAELAKLTIDEKLKASIKDRISGKTKEEISESIKKEFEYLDSILKIKGKDPVNGVPAAKGKVEENKNEPWTTKRISEDSRIPENLKVTCSEILVLEGSEKMVEFLKQHKIELS